MHMAKNMIKKGNINDHPYTIASDDLNHYTY